MKRVVAAAVVAAVGAGGVGCPALAGAGPGVAAPTVTVTTTVGGQALPVSGVSAHWTVHRPGVAATLDVSGLSVTATTTRVQAVWTSVPRRADGRALTLTVDAEHSQLLPGLAADADTVRIEARHPGGRWRALPALGVSAEYSPLQPIGLGVGVDVIVSPAQVLQWRVVTVQNRQDTGDGRLTETVTLR